MTQLVAIVHPLTGKTYHMHPDIAAQKHRWVHPDPSVPTPAESLPLFEMAEVERVFARLTPTRTAPTPAPDTHSTTRRGAALEKARANVT